MPKVNVITLGCKVNAYESEVIKEKFITEGYILTEECADVIVINTCSVTNVADAKSRKMIRKAKKENPDAIIIVCGCSAENHQEKLQELDIDILIGNKDKSKIIDLLNEYILTKNKYIHFYNNSNITFEDMSLSKFSNQCRAFVKIQDGCNNYCSYCIIPKLRGNIRSKNFIDAVNEVNDLVKNGHKEIVLTGINTGAYGIGTDYDLVDLINEISNNPNLLRIRISSIEITEINDKFLDMLRNNSKVCNHLHIPLQSGSNTILKLMNRKYNTEYFRKVIEKIRSINSDISITTDVIVGFPSEESKEFEETVEFCKSINFSKIHVFPYSLRNGTKASEMIQVNSKVKKERSNILNKVSQELEKEYYLKFLNQKMEIIIEESDNNRSVGHTSNYLKIMINEILNSNEVYGVILNAVENNIAIGEVIELVKG